VLQSMGEQAGRRGVRDGAGRIESLSGSGKSAKIGLAEARSVPERDLADTMAHLDLIHVAVLPIVHLRLHGP